VYEIVVIGTSLGGFNALRTVLGGLSKEFPLPLVIVQHRGCEADDCLVEGLSKVTSLIVSEPFDKEQIQAGHAYIAPPNYHLLVERGHLSLSTEAYVNYARPSIDVLFESAADAYQSDVIGVILTGASADGAKGAAKIAERGGLVIVQEPSTAEASVMPASAVAQGASLVRPLCEIANFLVNKISTSTCTGF